MKKKELNVEGFAISMSEDNYINITDIAKSVSEAKPAVTIQSWMRNTQTIRYLFEWENLHNKKIKVSHLADLLELSTNNRINFSVEKWIDIVGAIGMFQKKGRGGGTFAHSEIALDFAYWLSPKFKVYLNKEFLRLKAEEQLRLGDPLNIKRYLTSGNYSLLVSSILSQTDERLLTHPQPYKGRLPIASESDMLNKIVFKSTAKEWRLQNTDKPTNRNQRDYASILELVILNNLEFLDSMLLQWDLDKEERKNILQDAYDFQYPVLKRSKTVERLQKLADKDVME